MIDISISSEIRRTTLSGREASRENNTTSTFPMQGRILPILINITVLMVSAETSSGQIALTGMVADSASMVALPNVNVTTKKSDLGTVTDIRGSFTLDISEGDSIIFSRVGYYTKILPVEAVREVVIIFLKEESRMLRPVEIEDRVIIPWLPPLPPYNPWKNPTFDPRSTQTPGFQGVQTFGPGYVFRGALSRFSKEKKEKRKLAKVHDENYRSRNYVGLVNDPQVKGKIIEDYDLKEDDYYRLLAKFNEKNKDVIYRLEGPEVVALLVLFFSENAPEKERH